MQLAKRVSRNNPFQTWITQCPISKPILRLIGSADLLEPRSKGISTDDRLVRNVCRNIQSDSIYNTRCTRGVRVVFSVTRMRSSNSARINKLDFRTEKSCSVHMTVFEIVAVTMLSIGCNYWHDVCSRSVKTMLINIFAKNYMLP